ncbi:MAG: hypothetical protein AB1679_32320 [Actinomycetota bacterium]
MVGIGDALFPVGDPVAVAVAPAASPPTQGNHRLGDDEAADRAPQATYCRAVAVAAFGHGRLDLISVVDRTAVRAALPISPLGWWSSTSTVIRIQRPHWPSSLEGAFP